MLLRRGIGGHRRAQDEGHSTSILSTVGVADEHPAPCRVLNLRDVCRHVSSQAHSRTGVPGTAPVKGRTEVSMKRIALFVIGIMAVSIVSLAQGRGGRGAPLPPPPLAPGASQADVDKALIAAPASQKDQATVIKWKPDFTYEMLRKGTNRLVC